jgi:MOSC domain-containing protein YiiM
MPVVGDTTYTRRDARGTLAALGPWWQQLTEGRAAAPALAVAVTNADELATLLGAARADDGLDPVAALGRLADLAVARIDAGAPSDDVGAVLATALAGLRDAGAALRAAGALPPTVTGTVAQLNVSDGGVPKQPVDHVLVDVTGVVGDRQASRRHHGRPWQALCLWSADVIDALATEGHPIAPGRAGENVTVRGLPWAHVRPAVRVRLGEVLVEAAPFSLPCSKNAAWFIDRDFNRMHHERGAVSRIYASVLETGRIATGDAAVLEP